MVFIDSTQKELKSILQTTEKMMNSLLSTKTFCGDAKIICNLDLGFPHDVIRIAGGFATGIYVAWNSITPFIPIDLCMNVCTVSVYRLNTVQYDFFNERNIEKVLFDLKNSSYIANFHRGNHFICLAESVIDGDLFIIIHSSAAEFETLYNGLYPVESNYFFERIKTFFCENRYLRYLDGQAAELFQKIASNLYFYNENRHDFIISMLVKNSVQITESKHYHHYGMPSSNQAVIGCHLIKAGDCAPLLTRPGENIYTLKYNKALDKVFSTVDGFTTPHGFGKCHVGIPNIKISHNVFRLDSIEYKIQYGESLRDHPNLQLRNLAANEFLNYLSMEYEYQIIQEYKQLFSYNKSGFVDWRSYEK